MKFSAKSRFFIYIIAGVFVFTLSFLFAFHSFAAHTEVIEGLPLPIESIPNYENLQGQAIDKTINYMISTGLLEAGEDYVVLNAYTRASGDSLTEFYLSVFPADSFACDFSHWVTDRYFSISSASSFASVQCVTSSGYIGTPYANTDSYVFNADYLYGNIFLGRIVATRNINRIYDSNDILCFQKGTILPGNPPQDLHSLNPEDYETPDAELPDPEEPDNLLGSLKGFFQGLINKIVQAINNVVNAIIDGINTLTSNIIIIIDGIKDKIQSVIDTITGFFDYIFEAPDITRIKNKIDNSSIGKVFTLGNSIYTFFGSFLSTFRSEFSTTVPSSATLEYTIDFTGTCFESYFDDVVTYNFNWYNKVRSTVVTLVTTLMIFGWAIYFYKNLTNLINGTASGMSEVNKEK